MYGNIRYSEILSVLNAQNIYSAANLSSLTMVLRPAQAASITIQKIAIDLYNFHNSLIQALNLAYGVLDNNNLSKELESEGDDGVIIFQIIIEGEGLETRQYIKIFAALNELVETISKVLKEQQKESEIVLLDSGSDTNVGVKSGIETAKSLFLIFKEIWDYITNFRFYKQKQKNETLVESLSIRAEIMKKVEEGVLTKEEGMQYLHMIKTRTDELIGMKVLPKQIVGKTNQFENKKLLLEFEDVKLLASGDTSQ